LIKKLKMTKAPIPSNENEPLQDLLDYALMDTAEEEDFDEIVRLASNICNTPISLISLVDSDRQWFKARVGWKKGLPQGYSE